MEEEALLHAHSLFKKDGYNGNINEFKSLISKDKEALDYSYSLFKKDGYNGSQNDFTNLVGLKKKDSSDSSGQKQQKESLSSTKGRVSLLDSGKTKPAVDLVSSIGKSKGIEEFKSKKSIFKQTPEEVRSNAMKSTIGLTEKTSSAIPVSTNKPLKPIQKKSKEKGLGLDINNVREQLNKADFKTIESFDLGKSSLVIPKDFNERQNFIIADKDVFNKALEESYQTGVMKTREAQITKSDLASIDDEYEKLSKGESWSERIGSATKGAWDYIVSYGSKPFKMEKPFEKERREVIAEAFKNKKVLTDKQVEEKVKENFYLKRVNEIKSSRVASVNATLTDAEQYALTKYNGIQRKNLSKEEKDIQDGANDLIHSINSFADEKTKLYNEWKDKDAPKEVVDRYDYLTQNININTKLLHSSYNKLTSVKTKLGKFEEEKEYYNKEQEVIKDMNKRVASSILGLTSGTAKFFSDYIAPSIGPLGIGASIGSKELALKTKKEQEEINKELQTTKTIESVGDLARYVEETVGNNLAPTVALLFGGEVGMGIMAAASAGEKSFEIENDKNLSLFEKKAIPLLWGSTMLLPMATQLKTLRGAGRMIDAAQMETDKAITRSLSEKIWSGIRTESGQVLKLGTELKGMGIAQAVIDSHIGKDVDFYEVASDLKPYREAVVLHGLNKVAATAVSKVAEPFINPNERVILKSNAEVLTNLHEALKSPDTTPEEASVIRSQIDRVVKESNEVVGSVIDKMSKMTDSDYSKTLDLHKKVNELAKEAFQVKNSESMSDDVKRVALDKLKKEMSGAVKDLNNHLENFTPMEKPFKVNEESLPKEKPVEPTEEQTLQDLRDKNFVFLKYKRKSDVPDEMIDKISSTNNDTGEVTVTLTKSRADYLLNKKLYEENAPAQKPIENVTQKDVFDTKQKASEEQNIDESKNEEIKSEKTKKVSDDYVSLSDEIKAKEQEIADIDSKIKRARSESRKSSYEETKAELEKQKAELESKKEQSINSDSKMKYIHDNMDKLIKELEKSNKIKKEPCNI